MENYIRSVKKRLHEKYPDSDLATADSSSQMHLAARRSPPGAPTRPAAATLRPWRCDHMNCCFCRI